MIPTRERERSPEVRINKRIRVPEVRVIDAEGEQLGILPTAEALKRAEDVGLDLVEVQPKALPPVCRMMDYGKYLYLQKQKQKNNTSFQQLVKEVKLKPKTGPHDIAFKLDHIREFLKEGHKAKVAVMFKGREIVHQGYGRNHLDLIAKTIVDEGLGTVESAPRLEGRNMILILAPNSAVLRAKEKDRNA
jgi:translation initiation factor IF-3